MANVGPDIMGGYDLIPPPGATRRSDDASGESIAGRFNLKKGLKKFGKGLKKVSLAPVKLAAKGLKAAAKFAAKPIRKQFLKLTNRRANFLAWDRRKQSKPTAAEKREASAWSVKKMKRNPAGRLGVAILKATWGTSVAGVGDYDISGDDTSIGEILGDFMQITGGDLQASILANPADRLEVSPTDTRFDPTKRLRITPGYGHPNAASGQGLDQFIVSPDRFPREVDSRNTRLSYGPVSVDQNSMGFTGAEIAAAAATIVASMAAMMQSLNKPGEAPANPQAATPAPEAQDSQPPEDSPPVDVSEPSAEAGALTTRWSMTRAGWRMPSRYITLQEAEALIPSLMKKKNFLGVVLYPTAQAAENELVDRLYRQGVGLVTDFNALPDAEKKARAKGGGGAASLLGAVNGKKAYRNRKPSSDPACRVADPNSRYPGETEDEFESRIARKAAGRKGLRGGTFTMGDLQSAGVACNDTGCTGLDDCCNH